VKYTLDTTRGGDTISSLTLAGRLGADDNCFSLSCTGFTDGAGRGAATGSGDGARVSQGMITTGLAVGAGRGAATGFFVGAGALVLY